ncbi:glycosyltransferase family 4 protein [Actinacidiphila bryophytorum]|uniref:Glycosyltransferase involved in cell wall bisynthesis n=1 Tax=Actinacidiphila bryophytorum TaxID=1436133 RepID=A0A9W4E6B7_9ACTN|nr:glycosyltransferase [Actinacidiphila bryophytorum]CAG7629688.1 Glycosyltransferase involved in cell wall bisynthesis [Actinacidiphila bryophytorum]
MTAEARPLRVALLSYKGNPYCGGQGVYVRHLSRELAALGHSVEVIGAQPYPVLDALGDGVTLTELPSLDLYRQPDPFRTPKREEYRDWIDLLEVATMWTGGFPEPLTFSLRARRHLAGRRADFDVVHDNQTLGYGLLGLPLPLVTTVHHPITVDRRLDLAAAPDWKRRASIRRWYGFTRMQKRVAGRLPSVLTVSGSSSAEITADLGVRPERIHTVPIGADTRLFSPDPAVAEVPGRIVTTSSADVPLKGLVFLVEALAKVRVQHPDAHLVVVGNRPQSGPVAEAIEAFGLEGAVDFVKGISDEELVDLIRSAEVACVPSLYEGFSLPAAEAMATGTALVATTGGAVPEVAGPDGETCLAVPPGDAGALAAALDLALGDPVLRRRLASAGRARVLAHFTWTRAAAATAEHYREAIARQAPPRGAPRTARPAAGGTPQGHGAASDLRLPPRGRGSQTAGPSTQGRGALRAQPTTGARVVTDPEGQLLSHPDHRPSVAGRAVPRAPDMPPPERNSTPAGDVLAPERNSTPPGEVLAPERNGAPAGETAQTADAPGAPGQAAGAPGQATGAAGKAPGGVGSRTC